MHSASLRDERIPGKMGLQTTQVFSKLRRSKKRSKSPVVTLKSRDRAPHFLPRTQQSSELKLKEKDNVLACHFVLSSCAVHAKVCSPFCVVLTEAGWTVETRVVWKKVGTGRGGEKTHLNGLENSLSETSGIKIRKRV